MEWLSAGVLVANPGVVVVAFYFLNRRLSKLEDQVNNGLAERVYKLAIGVATLKGQQKGKRK